MIIAKVHYCFDHSFNITIQSRLTCSGIRKLERIQTYYQIVDLRWFLGMSEHLSEMRIIQVQCDEGKSSVHSFTLIIIIFKMQKKQNSDGEKNRLILEKSDWFKDKICNFLHFIMPTKMTRAFV